MEKYIFSGSLTNAMHDILVSLPQFEPISILTTQVDRAGVKQAIKYKQEGFCNFFFLDSGAFSIHTGKAKTTIDEYIDYINSIDEYIDVCAELDTIPGKFGEPKSEEDYIESARKSWESFLYMRSKVKSPDKVMPVFHYGESFDVLRGMLSWKDENGRPLEYVGISPANDSSMKIKDAYLKDVYDLIAKSDNPNVKTHLYGYTSLQGLAKFPCYSADSISHRSMAGYNKIYTSKWGVISLSDRDRTSKTKSNMSFVRMCDEETLTELTEYMQTNYNMSIDQLVEDSSSRVVVCMMEILKDINGKYKYSPTRIKKTHKLFQLD